MIDIAEFNHIDEYEEVPVYIPRIPDGWCFYRTGTVSKDIFYFKDGEMKYGFRFKEFHHWFNH